MFNPIFDSLQKATETTIRMQEQMFKNWVSLWPGLPSAPPAGAEQASNFQKKWVQSMTDLVKRQGEALEVQFRTGLRNLEEAFRLAGVRGFSPSGTFEQDDMDNWQECTQTCRGVVSRRLPVNNQMGLGR